MVFFASYRLLVNLRGFLLGIQFGLSKPDDQGASYTFLISEIVRAPRLL